MEVLLSPIAHFASNPSHICSLICPGFCLVPPWGEQGLYLLYPRRSARHRAMNCCQMNEPEGETAPCVLGQCGSGQGSCPVVTVKTPVPKEGSYLYRVGLGDAGLYPAQVCHECHDKPSDTRRGSHRLPGWSVLCNSPPKPGDDTGLALSLKVSL